MLFPILYMISDFLIDQKTELARLDKLFKKAESEDRRAEIKEQQEYIFNQGLQALRRHEHEIPSCVWIYYLGKGPRPSMDLVSKELQGIHGMRRKTNRQIAYAVVAFLVTVLSLLAIFF